MLLQVGPPKKRAEIEQLEEDQTAAVDESITDATGIVEPELNEQVETAASAETDATTAVDATIEKEMAEIEASVDAEMELTKNKTTDNARSITEAPALKNIAPGANAEATAKSSAEKTWVDPENPANFIPPGWMSKADYDKERKNMETKQRRNFATIEPKKVPGFIVHL